MSITLGIAAILVSVGLIAAKFSKYNLATLIIMGVGAILFFIAPWNFFDSDVFGLIVFVIGLLMLVVGLIQRKAGGHRQVSQ